MRFLRYGPILVLGGLWAGWLLTGKSLGIHNSLSIREQLRQANRDPLRIARRDPHRCVGRDPKALPGKGDLEMTGPTSRHVMVVPDDPRSDGWELVAREYATAAEAAQEALVQLRAVGSIAPTAGDRQHLQEETDLTELIYRTFLSCAHTVEFLRLRRDWKRDRDAA